MTEPFVRLALVDEKDVVVARQHAREVARAVGFDAQDQVRVATTVSEIARNAVTYARQGTLEMRVLRDGGRQRLAIDVRDRGPGIADLDAVLDGRYRSPTGMGNGILGARRLMDEFAIETGPAGTHVALAKLLPRHAPPLSAPDVAQRLAGLAAARPDAAGELRQQNAELMQSLSDLAARTDELSQLTNELESTNRGVVALHGELEATAAELKRASDLKTRFLSNISHEFRTPLNSILALSRLLLERTDGDLTEEQERQVRFISQAAAGLTDLVNDLLDIAKVEAGKVEVKPSRFSVADLFGALRGLLRPLRTSEAVDLVFEEPVGLPVLFQDEAKVTQILRNFIANALKFTPTGEVRVSAQFKAPDQVVFCVQDTGIGIPREHHERIFEEFEQVPHSLQAKVQGTGLGLPLSRKLSELLHGKVAVDSEPGAGSSFFLEIPAEWRAAGDEPEQAYLFGDAAGRARLLIADDEEAFRYVMRRMIAGDEYDIVETGNGEEALELALSSVPDVVILDLNMPGRDGYSVLEALGRDERTRRVPVIVSTSLVLTDRDRARLARSHAILSKAQLSREVLAEVLASALGARAS